MSTSMSMSMADVLTPMGDTVVTAFQEDLTFNPSPLASIVLGGPSSGPNPSSSSSAPTPTSSSDHDSSVTATSPSPSSKPNETSQPSSPNSQPSSTTSQLSLTSFQSSSTAAPSTPPVTTTLTTTVTDSTPAPTPAPTSTASKSGKDHQNVIMMITGIVIGVVGFLLVGGVLFLFRRRKKRRALMKKNKAEEHHPESYRERSETTNRITFMSDESSDRELLVVLQTVSGTGDFPTDVRHESDVGDLLIQNRDTVLRIPSSAGSAETLFDTYTLQNSSLPVSNFEGEKQQDKIPISYPEKPRRLSQTLRDNYIPNDTAKLEFDFPAPRSAITHSSDSRDAASSRFRIGLHSC